MQSQRGFSLLELLMVVGIIGVLAGIAIPLLQQALLRAHVAAVTTDAKAVHSALKKHYIDNSEYADTVDVASFEPLASGDYYSGGVMHRLIDSAADAYDSPDDNGVNQEFWMEMTLGYDPTVRFVVADSDDAPLGGGAWLDGVFLFRNGVLTPLQSVNR